MPSSVITFSFCSETFSQGRRRYFVDLRQNQRGRFVKVTMLAGGKTFIAIPGKEQDRDPHTHTCTLHAYCR